jgi:hypothetical protein
MKLTKNNPYLFIFSYSTRKGIYDSYSPISNYDLSNLSFHWDVMGNYNYVCEIENAVMNSKTEAVCVNEYG